MPREIRRKIIDNELQAPDNAEDFEKSLESQLAADFETASDRSDMGLLMPEEDGDFSPSKDLFDFSDKTPSRDAADSSHGFSLDAFEPPVEEPTEPVPSSQEQTVDVSPPPARAKKLALRKILMAGVPCLVVVLLLSVFMFKMLHKEPPKPAKQYVTQIRKQIVVPHFQEKADFFLVAAAQDGKFLVSLSLEFEFHSEERLQYFREESTVFRDVVYRFLEAQHPQKNTLKDWQSIVQKDLTAHLQSVLPNLRADLMRVSRLERL